MFWNKSSDEDIRFNTKMLWEMENQNELENLIQEETQFVNWFPGQLFPHIFIMLKKDCLDNRSSKI